MEAVAVQGPGAVYAWTHGENSLMARKAKSLTWADLGETDPVAGCHKLIEAQEKALDRG